MRDPQARQVAVNSLVDTGVSAVRMVEELVKTRGPEWVESLREFLSSLGFGGKEVAGITELIRGG